MKWQKKTIISKNIIFSIIFITFLSFHGCFNSWNFTEYNNSLINNGILVVAQGSAEDTTAPVIIFIQPLENYTTITTRQFNIIVNISDENPPLNGDVIIRISNLTNLLFNASMDKENEIQWSYNWNNISAYQNWEEYIIQIWANDSSLTKNLGKSEEFYIYLNLSNGLGIWTMIIYIIVISLIFAGMVIYINKKHQPKIIE